ncbi:hypothetical protein PLANPX_1269 [Lacipirellula parvula]|uniref:Uncharacterized protein n=1 Tax=Lacipirellula parvula TaxID=2650471 RepID=A0A5K7X739_9BACT|nr:hypothetical protein PLANPX_1269 [Lacipirellula parvula]
MEGPLRAVWSFPCATNPLQTASLPAAHLLVGKSDCNDWMD